MSSVCRDTHKRTHLLPRKHLIVLLVKLPNVHQLLSFELVNLYAAGALAELNANVSLDLPSTRRSLD
jgi:hypothetical protein